MAYTQQSTLADNIRALRLKMGLTQTGFAAIVGASFTSVNRWENGKATPSPLAMKALEQLGKDQGIML